MSHDEAVARGAALLDEAQPGWADRLDLDTFDIRSMYYCVVGQLYRDGNYSGYYHGLQALMAVAGIDADDVAERSEVFAQDHGLEAVPDVFGHAPDEEWSALQDVWLTVITARRTT